MGRRPKYRRQGRLKGDRTPEADVVAAVSCPYCGAAKGERCFSHSERGALFRGEDRNPHDERWVRFRRLGRAQRMTRNVADLTAEDRRRLGLDRGK